MDKESYDGKEDQSQDPTENIYLENDQSSLADPEERQVIYAVLASFHQYRRTLHYNTTHRRRQNFYALPSYQWQMLANSPFSILDTFNAVDDAIDHNADLADAILNIGLESFGLSETPEKDTPLYWHQSAKANDMSKTHSTIRQFYRDWSAEGYEAEVKPILNIILNDLKQAEITTQSRSTAISATTKQSPPKLLLPGAGLGRLVFELSMQGFNVEGNEISYHQLLASNFILNHTQHANQFKLYPNATTFTNNLSRSHQLKQVTIPDIHPATAIANAYSSGTTLGQMSMTASDFTLCYSAPEYTNTYDAVVSVYFIDTAPNLLRYIDTVRNCLLPDTGIWINIGPLLWHFDDRALPNPTSSDVNQSQPAKDIDKQRGIDEPGSIELTDDEIIMLLQQMGFEILSHEIISSSGVGGYIQDPESMLQNRYRCSHWVARKK